MERILEGGAIPPLPNGAVVTVGTFDGVHRGHLAVLTAVRQHADELAVPAAVITFDRHPATVVRPESAPRLLTSLSQKLELFAEHGIDYTHVLRFDEERSLETPEEFVHEIVVGSWHARVAVEGRNFHFGHRRRGDIHVLEEAGARWGFKVVPVEVVEQPDGVAVSSDRVRAALAHANVAEVSELLERMHELTGVVEHGDKRGRTIGFPTANVAVAGDLQLPADGVYAGWYEGPDGSTNASAINIGRRPTFYSENGLLLVEAHLLDFDGDLYGEHARVRIQAWLRGETRFGSVDDLKAQLVRDVEKTRQLLLS